MASPGAVLTVAHRACDHRLPARWTRSIATGVIGVAIWYAIAIAYFAPMDGSSSSCRRRRSSPLRHRGGAASWRDGARALCRAPLSLMVAATVMAPSLALAESPNGVRTLDPPGAIKAEGTWSLGVRAGDFVFVAGMQGIDPATNSWLTTRKAASARPSSISSLSRNPRARACKTVSGSPSMSAICTATRPWSTRRKRSSGAALHIRPGPWSRSSACSTTISSRSTRSSTRRSRSSDPGPASTTPLESAGSRAILLDFAASADHSPAQIQEAPEGDLWRRKKCSNSREW